MRLEDIGFYTLSDARAKDSNETSSLYRCEMILTDRCNFKCIYCHPLREECRATYLFNKRPRHLIYGLTTSSRMSASLAENL